MGLKPAKKRVTKALRPSTDPARPAYKGTMNLGRALRRHVVKTEQKGGH